MFQTVKMVRFGIALDGAYCLKAGVLGRVCAHTGARGQRRSGAAAVVPQESEVQGHEK